MISQLVTNRLDKRYIQVGLSAISIFCLKKLINNYKQTILAQYLVSLGATILQKSKSRSDKAVNSLKVNKKKIFHGHMLEERLCIVVKKHVLRQCFRLKHVLNQLLMFHQTSGSCSYKMVSIKCVYSKVLYGKCILICMACLFRSTI